MIFVDTGPLLARCVKRDQHHARALGAFRQLGRSGESCLTTHFVVDELATLLVRRTDPNFAVQVVRDLYSSTVLEIARIDRSIELEALTVIEKYADQLLSFTDATSFVVMKKRQIRTALAFDRHFVVAGFQLFE